MKKSFLFLILALIGLIAGFFFILPGTSFKQDNGTNTNAANQDKEDFYQDLKENYPDIYQMLPEDDKASFVIPGLLETETLVSNGDEKGKVKTARDMTPQGLSFVGDYIIISAYSKGKELNSVLWVIEKQSGEFLKTIVLPTISHVGGMAYDTEHQRLWITTTDEESTSQISALNLQTVLDDDFKQSKEAISFDYQINLEDISGSSYMTYHNQALFVGYFDKDDKGHIGYYKLDDNGFPQKDQNKATAVFDTPEQIQGIAIIKDKVIFSQSYGNKDSKLLVFNNPGIENWKHFTENSDQFIQQYTTPAYMQQVFANGDELYLLFESSATQYRLNPSVESTDRVIAITLPEK
ncbi:hypothetical protein [Streptococcus ovuberis]|uniref:Uncharacterized protein n=1 Tax=Streptococcus ovuberis TaxID=1936207 RepID=A0A7X6MWQ6_9STRE|nr:hypothetical protein [Streptococcus ovuberis]NKZ19785.1 hypothetical protein [Streptococcus ovuberis]